MTVKDRSGHAAGLKRAPLLSFYFFARKRKKYVIIKIRGEGPFRRKKDFCRRSERHKRERLITWIRRNGVPSPEK